MLHFKRMRCQLEVIKCDRVSLGVSIQCATISMIHSKPSERVFRAHKLCHE